MNRHNFVALDVETTGLDVERDQVLQIGAVAYGGDGYVAEFTTLVKYARYEGHPYALQMNAGLLRRLADGEGRTRWNALIYFHKWVLEHCDDRPYSAGFNVGKFDRAMLERDMPSGFDLPLHHRVLELGSLYACPSRGGRPASSKEVCQDVLDLDEMPHDALEDARINAALHARWVIDRCSASGHAVPEWAPRVWRRYTPPEIR